MCGRYSLFAPPDRIEQRFDATFVEPFEPRYNAAPGQPLPVITGEDSDIVQCFEWGLIPSWADDAKAGNDRINARAETVDEKPSFRRAYERRRCLVLADGFYEWKPVDGGTQPYRVTLEDDRLFAMAGLWEQWTPPTTQTGLGDFAGEGSDTVGDPEPRTTFTIITTEPNDIVEPLHDRMAVVLPEDAESSWLAGDPGEVSDLLSPYPATEMRSYRVSSAVNDPTNDSPAVAEPAVEHG